MVELAKSVKAGKATSYVSAAQVLADLVLTLLGGDLPACPVCGKETG